MTRKSLQLLGPFIVLFLTTVPALPRGESASALAGPCPRQQSAQAWVPVVAIQVSQLYDISGGRATLVSERVGPSLRSRDGSTYLRLINVIGTQMEERAELIDRASGKVIALDYGTRKWAVERQLAGGHNEPMTAERFHAHLGHKNALGTKQIGGVLCEGWRVPAAGPGHPAGEIWVAPSLNYLIVKAETEFGGRKIVSTLENIQAGRDPDPAFFRVPKGFEAANQR